MKEGQMLDAGRQGPAPHLPSEPVELLRLLYPELRRVAQQIAPRDAEDLVQEALLRVLVAHPGFGGVEHPVGYAKAVLVRLAARRPWNNAKFEVPFGDLELQLDKPADPMWEENVDARLDIARDLSQLAPKQRTCVYLRVAHGLSDMDIATLLGTRTSTVRSQISRACERLRRSWPELAMRERENG